MIILGLFLGLWAAVFLAYWFFPFSSFALIQQGVHRWILYVAFHPVALSLGFVCLHLRAGTHLQCEKGDQGIGPLVLDLRGVRRYCLWLLGIGGVFTAAKIGVVVSHLGVPDSFAYLFTVRIAYLFGDLRIPPLVELLGRYPLIALAVLGGIVYWAEGKVRYAVYALLLLTLNNLAIGGRGDIGFALILFLSTVLVFLHISGRPVVRSLLDARLILMAAAAVGLAVLVFVYRGGLEQVRDAIDVLILYFTGTIPATAYIAEQVYRGNLFYGVPVMTFHGILRFLEIGLDAIGVQVALPPPDFGVVPVYADFAYAPVYVESNYGMNSYTYAAYLLPDWGLAGSLVLSFLLGMGAGYALLQVKVRVSPFRLVAAIMMTSLLFATPLYLTSKLISWWMAGAVTLHALSRCAEWQHT